MANFCKKCGYKLEAEWWVCPNCGYRVRTQDEPLKTMVADDLMYDSAEENISYDASAQEAVPEYTPYAEQNMYDNYYAQEAAPVYGEEAYQGEEAFTPAPTKRKKKRVVVIVSIVLAAITLLSCGGFFLLRFIRVKTAIVPNYGNVIKNDYGEFMMTGVGYVNLECPEEGPVKITFNGDEVSGNPRCIWVAEDCYYYYFADAIMRLEVVSETESETDIWLSTEDLERECDFNSDDYVDISSAQYCDGYLYFLLQPDDYDSDESDFYNSSAELYRINEQTKEIELVDSETRISSYLAADNVIYFTGSCGGESGVFKIKPDGRNRKLLYEIDEDELYYYNDNYDDYSYSYSYVILNGLCNGKLYLYEYSYDAKTGADNAVIRINTNGKGEKEVISGEIFNFMLAPAENKAYFVEYNEDDNVYDLCEMSLSSLKSKTLIGIDEEVISTVNYMDKKIYIRCYGSVEDSYRLVGAVYDIKKKEATGIYYDTDNGDITTDDVDEYISIY